MSEHGGEPVDLQSAPYDPSSQSLSRSATFDDVLMESDDVDSSDTFSSSRAEEEEVQMESDDIRCVCQSVDDDGFTIQCEDCLVWQHAVCVGISKESVPESYFCEVCRPDLHQKDGYWIPGAYASGGPGRKRKATLTVQPSKLNYTEIPELIISKECSPGFAFLSTRFHPELIKAMPQPGMSWSRVNFEFIPSMVAFPGAVEFLQAGKACEIREIRGRGGGTYNKKSLTGGPPSTAMASSSSLKLGVFPLQDIDPGVLIMEYLGQVQVPQLLPKGKASPERVLQSHVLYIPNLKPVICVDARKLGNAARHIRRSCRPNCDIKLVLTGASSPTDTHIGLFARNSILEGDELLLPIDFDHGNDLFRYECACGNADLCLAPEAAVPAPKIRQASAASTFDMVDTLKPLVQRSKTPTAAAASAAPIASAPSHKLSREERKLQQYIEQIEKMDSAERRSASRKSSSGILSSASNVGGESRSPSSKASPKRTGDSSPRKSLPSRPSDALSEDDMMVMEEVQVVVVGKRSPGKSPRRRSIESVDGELDAAAPEKPIVAPKAKKSKKQMAKKKDEEEEEGQVSTEQKKKTKKLKQHAFSVDDEDDVDVGKPEAYTGKPVKISEIDRSLSVSPFSSSSPGMARGVSAQDSPDASSSGPAEASTSQPETPSKKRVSLSDYMRKRRATGDLPGREEGELPSPSELAQSVTPAALEHYQQQQQPPSVVFHRPEYNKYPSASSNQQYSQQYEMPPHLTPPPPLHTAAASALPSVGSGEALMDHGAGIARSESTLSYERHRHQQSGYDPRRDHPQYHQQQQQQQYREKEYPQPPAGEYPSGVSKYGYVPHRGGSRPYPPQQQQYDQGQQQQQQVYRPRPSLLKAAQDLPTRWEEQAAASRPDYRSMAPMQRSSKSEYDDYRRPAPEQHPGRYYDDRGAPGSGDYHPPSGYREYPSNAAGAPPPSGPPPQQKQQYRGGWRKPGQPDQPPPGRYGPPPRRQ